ncbi:histidine kinase [Chryseobacterium lactis]|uniref:Histidine kinase n=1 Tax=Chryseobacterium lactis TaxID=1241981 RepID=A0A3G6RP54_CHRLC|nr:histidine kinase [Chryseobacterium lactis]AZA81087.1 histidine kinase [Chryseobacterium lactis]AZB06088.1 histidine kinase [Chryseobacterium lactis]PNW14938.1 histidine kinase [Chryseobacterium lactis]
MKKNQIIWILITYWGFNFIGTIITPNFFFPEKNLYNMHVLRVTFFIVKIVTFYLSYLVFFPKIFKLDKPYSVIFVFLLSFLVFVSLRYMIEEVALPATVGFRNYGEKTGLFFYFFDNIYNSSLPTFIAGILWVLGKYGVAENDKKQLLIEKKQAELQALKTQINPHFIFNSLNNIYSLVYQKSEKALPAIEELSQLLRYSTKDLEKDFITLDKEVGYIDSLIGLEKLRIRNPELLLIEKNIQYPHLKISPMLLVPFVENAFKHGDFRDKGFEMRISDHDKVLHFYLLNFKKEKIKDSLSGIGIENVKKRLEILYPDHYQLDIKDTETEFVVDLKIDLQNG